MGALLRIPDERALEARLSHYEGLIFSTARRLLGVVEMEMEDMQQVLRVKCWKALRAYDPKKSRMSEENYVFMCVRDQAKDLARKKRRHELHIEQLVQDVGDVGGAKDRFESRYLSTDDEVEFSSAEDEGVLLPNTLSELEREVILLLYRDFKQSEAARHLGLGRYEMERAMKGIRTKLADWNPGAREDEPQNAENGPHAEAHGP